MEVNCGKKIDIIINKNCCFEFHELLLSSRKKESFSCSHTGIVDLKKVFFFFSISNFKLYSYIILRCTIDLVLTGVEKGYRSSWNGETILSVVNRSYSRSKLFLSRKKCMLLPLLSQLSSISKMLWHLVFVVPLS